MEEKKSLKIYLFFNKEKQGEKKETRLRKELWERTVKDNKQTMSGEENKSHSHQLLGFQQCATLGKGCDD